MSRGVGLQDNVRLQAAHHAVVPGGAHGSEVLYGSFGRRMIS